LTKFRLHYAIRDRSFSSVLQHYQALLQRLFMALFVQRHSFQHVRQAAGPYLYASGAFYNIQEG
jgi:hypothetical protein